MSNYLQNLIAKSFNQLEVARPRLASRFEPLSPSTPKASAEIQALETPNFEGAPGDLRSTGTTQEPQTDRQLKKALPSPTVNQPSQEIQTPVWRGNQQPIRFQQPTAEPQILVHQTTPQKPMDLQPVAPREIEKPPEESESPKQPFSEFNQSKTQLTRQQKEPPPAKDAWLSDRALMTKEEKTPLQLSLQPPSKKPVQTLSQNAPEQIRRPINESAAKQEMKESNRADLPDAWEANRISRQTRIALRVESHKAPGNLTPAHHLPIAQQSEVEAPPTINVTIGRIEVKATTVAAQSRKQVPSAQTMSLDEYLRKRNRGGVK